MKISIKRSFVFHLGKILLYFFNAVFFAKLFFEHLIKLNKISTELGTYYVGISLKMQYEYSYFICVNI